MDVLDIAINFKDMPDILDMDGWMGGWMDGRTDGAPIFVALPGNLSMRCFSSRDEPDIVGKAQHAISWILQRTHVLDLG